MNNTIDAGSAWEYLSIPSWFDDLDLTAQEFRLYSHLCRRAGNDDHEAWPGVESIARKCRLNVRTVRAGLKKLVGYKMLTRQERSGESTLYRIVPRSAWQAPSRLNRPSLAEANPLQMGPTPIPNGTDHPLQTGPTHPLQTGVGKGIPSEGIPGKEREYPPTRAKGDPLALPKSEEEAVKQAATRGVPESFARRAYKSKAGRGWRDSRGSPIGDWLSDVEDHYRAYLEKKAASQKNEPHRIKKQLDEVRRQIKEMGDPQYWHDWSQATQETYRLYKDREEALSNALMGIRPLATAPVTAPVQTLKPSSR